MKRRSSLHTKMIIGSSLVLVAAGWRIAVAETPPVAASPEVIAPVVAPIEAIEVPAAPAPIAVTPPEAKPPLEKQEYGPTKKGDTLAHIAMEVLPHREVSLEQMTWALYSINPQAFEKGDLNRIKTGVFLTVPTIQQANAVDAATAHRELERRAPAAPVREATPRPVRTLTPKAPKDPLDELQAQIRETQRERDEAAQEHQLLKARLAEMEKKIQELMRENAERDARLKTQSLPTK